MSDWQACLVKDIASPGKNSLSTGPFGSAISSKYFVDNGIPVIRGGNLSADIGTRIIDDGFVFVTENKANEFSRSAVRKGDLIFTCWGTINQVGLIDERAKYVEYIISNKQMKLTPDTAKADSLFLYYLFSSPEKQQEIINNGIGAAVPGFNLGQLRKMDLSLPILDEQKAIASVLSSLDDKIDLLHRQNKTLEAMAETLFRQWFVEEAQEDWEEVKLGDFFPVITGKKDANFSTDDGEYPFFTCSQLPIKAPAYSFDGAAILLAGNGDFNVKRYIGKFEAYQRTYVLIPYDTSYFSFLFTLMRFHLPEITGGHQGSVINFITKGMITDFKLLLPANRELIAEKLKKFNGIYTKVDSNAQQVIILEKLRDTLLPKLMSGEVRVAI